MVESKADVIGRLQQIAAGLQHAADRGKPFADNAGYHCGVTIAEAELAAAALREAADALARETARANEAEAAHNDETARSFDIYQQQREAEARAELLQQERDKWLKAFNESEQFQSGPTTRAEQAEAQLTALTAQQRQIREALTDLRKKFDALLIREVNVFGGIPAYGGRLGQEQTALRESIAGLLALEETLAVSERPTLPTSETPNG